MFYILNKSNFNFLTFYHKARLLTTLSKRPFENIMGKGENTGNKHFLIMFSTFSMTKFIPSHIYFIVCKVFQIGLV